MRIAILHYHFHPGGVRTVVENACASLRDRDYRFAILTGEPLAEGNGAPSGTLPQSGAPYRVLPDLTYGQAEEPGLLERAKALAAGILGGPPDLWHFHNHSLGKNATLPRLAGALAAEGVPVLLQIHDFAEDGRPDNYRYLQEALGADDPDGLGNALYPGGARVHYAALNGRDVRFLIEAGAPPGRVHLLPNAVHLPGQDAAGAAWRELGDTRLFLYPTRAIRRKNIGEFLLLARLNQLRSARQGTAPALHAVTMAPGNPVEKPIYGRWVALAAELGLPVEWEFGKRSGLSFGALMAGAEQIVTTSVGEGFGLAFLEPWLVGRPVAGRDLPEITRDFKEAGIRFPRVYEELRAPLGTGAGEFRASYRRGLARAFAAYGQELSAAELASAWEQTSAGGGVDFGKLDEAGQERVLRGSRDALAPLDHDFDFLIDPPPVTADLLKTNRRIIAETYSSAAYGQRLDALYQQVARDSPLAVGEQKLSGARLLQCFLTPSRFTPLRGVR